MLNASPGALTKRCTLFLPMMLLASSADAYIGPGAGLTAIGSLVALVAAVLLAVIGFLWFPLKRLLRKMRGGAGNSDSAHDRP